MAMLAGDQSGLDSTKCVKLAITHDIAEAIVGDITPHDGYAAPSRSQVCRTFFGT